MFANSIQSIMTTKVFSLPPDASIKQAVLLMTEHNIGCIIITANKNSKPIGIITERDVLKLSAHGKDINKITLNDVMTSPVNTVSKNMDLYEAAMYLEKHKFRRIVVTDHEGKLTGLVTQTDLKNHLGAVYYVRLKNIESIMSRDIITAEHDEKLSAITRRMNEFCVSCLVICKDNKPLGIVTERDITHLMASDEDRSDLLASKIIKSSLITISRNTSIYEATNIMKKQNIRRLVVVDGQNLLIGLITETDIVKHLEKDYLESMRTILEHDRNFVNTIKEGLFECSPSIDGEFTWINQAGARILGYKSSRQLIGKKIKDLFVNTHDLEQLFEMLNSKGEARDFNTVLRKSSGRQFNAEATFYFVEEEDNNLMWIEGILRDVTDRRRMEDKLKGYSIRLEKEVKEKTSKISKHNNELKEINAKLHELTIHDGLTGIKNFRYFSHVLDAEFKKAKRYKLPLSCIILDIDDFKFINDRFGHTTGDFALMKTAKLLEDTVRETDIVARYGGDEFTVILPNTNLESACVVGQKILERFKKYTFKKKSEVLGKISLSLGISTLSEEKTKTSKQMLEIADKAMYRTKEKGKSNICTCLDIENI